MTPLALLAISVMWIYENITTNYEGYETIHLVIGGWAVVGLTIIVGFGTMFFKGKDQDEISPMGVDA
jgi:hypothetical protein